MTNPFKQEFENTKFEFEDLFKKTDIKFKQKFRHLQKRYSIIIAVIFALAYFWIILPPLNIFSKETWFFVWVILGILTLIGGKSLKPYKLFRKLFVGIFVLFILLQIPSLKLFRAKSYADMIHITESNFTEDIKQLPISKIPTIDKDASIKLGQRKMGELLDLVSQFDIDDNTYTQINLNDHPVRVTPLKYNGFIKYLFNSSEGLPGYIKIDIVTGETELVKLEEKIKISKEDYLFRDVKRFARLRYPFAIFEDINFEVDDNGIPYWVIPTYTPRIFAFDGMDVNGAILINATNGEHIQYKLEEIPNWIDRIFNAERVIEHLNWNGMYKNGYINSLFAQKNVLQTTEGYNYIAQNDDVYLYTGYTSVAADESNVGFVLTNLRTKETKFYPVSSAEEFSAMESAEGAVQEKGYDATFPLLLNINNKPTYFLSLKDNGGLIKLYAFIDAQNYQRVSVGQTVQQALLSHTNGAISDIDNEDSNLPTQEIEGQISDIKEVVVNGNTHYYFTLSNSDKVFVTNISLSTNLPFAKNGDTVKLQFVEKNINEVISIEFIN